MQNKEMIDKYLAARFPYHLNYRADLHDVPPVPYCSSWRWVDQSEFSLIPRIFPHEPMIRCSYDVAASLALCSGYCPPPNPQPHIVGYSEYLDTAYRFSFW